MAVELVLDTPLSTVFPVLCALFSTIIPMLQINTLTIIM
jgi:hypothetical protein